MKRNFKMVVLIVERS